MKRTLLLLLSVVLWAGVGSAQTPWLNREPNRFIFLVDRSFSMARIDDETRQAVFDLIYGGINGQMSFGDEYAIWTFDEETHTRLYPLQNWDPQLNLSLASRAAKFLKSQPCHKQTRMDKAMADALGVVRAVSNLNVLIITDGGAPIQGTPFDEKINTAFHDQRKILRHEKKPFIAMLAARDGEMVAWAVHATGGDLTLPKPPVTAKVLQATATPAATSAAPPPPVETKPVETIVATAPPVVKPEPVKPATETPAPPPKPVPAQPTQPAPAAKPEPPPPPRPAPPQPSPLAPPRVEAPPPASPPATVPETKPVVPAPAAADIEPVKRITPGDATSAAPGAVLIEAPPAGADANRPAPVARRPPAQTALAVTPESFYSSRGLLFAGLGLLLVAGWLGVALLRRSRGTPQPSIITRSLERKEK